MSCTRRQFITRVGALAAVSGMAGRVVANTLNINGVRYGMVHDESLCIGCTACMDACREVNTVPEGVSRLTIIRSEPQGTFPDVKYRFFRHSCQHCDHAPCVESCPTKALTFGNLDDPNSDISRLLRQKTTYRYKLALGTKPKVYRVPFNYGEVSQ
ncbi:4Fe-4S dicluster domain-containing protein [Salmonella enterica]|nr:4Fe-4S dicluster domain-containing protein [Salmonella enterica]